MVISDLTHLEDTSQPVIGGLSIYITGNDPVELEIPEPIYGEPELLENGATVIRVIGWRNVKTIFYHPNPTM